MATEVINAGAETSREVAPGIHRIVMPVGARVNSCYAFIGDRRVILYDTAMDGDIAGYVAPYLRSVGRDIADVAMAVISHGDVDHFGGNAQLAALAPRALIACHYGDLALVSDPDFVFHSRYDELAADGLPDSPEMAQWCAEHAKSAPVDLLLTGGEQLRLDDGWAVEILHVPGHSTGHLAIRDLRSGALAVSDAVLGNSVNLADGSPAFPPTYRWARNYLATVDSLLVLSPSALLTAHYPTMAAEQAAEFLSTSRDFATHADQAVIDFVTAASRPVSLREIVLGVAADLGPWDMNIVAAALGQPVVGHLEWWTERGALVERTADDGIRTWSASP